MKKSVKQQAKAARPKAAGKPSSRVTIQSLQGQIATRDGTVAGQAAEILRLQAQISEAPGRITALERELASVKPLLSRTERALETIAGERDRAIEQVTALSSEIGEVRTKLVDAERRAAEFKQSADGAHRLVAETRQSIEELRHKVTSLTEERDKATAQVAEIARANGGLEASLVHAGQAYERIVAEQTRLVGSHDNAIRDLQQARIAEVKVLQGQIRERDAEGEGYREQLKAMRGLEGEVAALQTTVQTLISMGKFK